MSDSETPPDDTAAEAEEGRDPSGKSRGAIEIQTRAVEPNPLALMSAEDFQRSLTFSALAIERMERIYREVMKKGRHYGTIPGTKKPSLLQPGAQLLNNMAGFSARLEPLQTLGDGETGPSIHYRVRCELVNRDGLVVGEGLGSANDWETKHRYRYADKVCPICGVEAIKRARDDDPDQAYYCWKKLDGCGASFKPNDTDAIAAIESQPAQRFNPDPHDLDNTLLKMAAKRATIAATVSAHGVSDLFTQDDGAGQGQPRDVTSQKEPEPEQDPEELLSKAQVNRHWGVLCQKMEDLGVEMTEENKRAAYRIVCAEMEVGKFQELRVRQIPDLRKAIDEWAP